ncbi:MAG TPA: sigma factor-like helix-turn-helix DNA-binding protein [Nocardioides sp.]|uniref:sigma factor-like helix-turn-helix DNA-binding protein n=1 Tax=Nocardioides sp. TaxID=35761 RepID=UPI002E302B1C|nr:sigma factor-like helix-turn-helix DNA-binding protein [Nocardioides sp.]HEX5090382.1 sigma factor-like helix-turn-helix DNA-binding protein [Nocardioides sp.]
MPRTLPRSAARSPEGFETFYKDVRARLLLQTYALTGDLHAAQRAVRDAMVVAWHHWRKVSRLDRPEDYARPLAWTRAQRRSTARWWARQKDIDPEARKTLDALGKLSTTQRKVLLLAHLTALPIDDMAREVGVTRANAERELQLASAQFSVHRGVPSTGVRGALEALAPGLDEIRWPRPSIVMRAGAARRRAHTAVGVAAAVAAVLVTGSVVTDASGARPALATKGILEGSSSTPQTKGETAPPEPDPLTPQALLGVQQVSAAIPGSWSEGATSTNTAGDGLVFTCQGGRYADMRGIGALVRTFTGTAKSGLLTAGQSAEASADAAAAERTYQTMLGWYAGCMSPRVQLLSTHRVTGVGDEATMLVLRSWADPVTTEVVGVARTGGLSTTVVNTLTGMTDPKKEPDLAPSVDLLARAVSGLCTLPDAGTCTGTPKVKDSTVVPVGRHPSLLVEADLPPVPTIDQPWAGTAPSKAKENVAATRCDNTDFSGPDFTKAFTRTFVIPAATQLPPEFGLSETVGALPPKQAQQFVDDIRGKLTKCPDDDLGTTVEKLVEEESGAKDLTVWRLTVEVSQEESVRFLMAVIRSGNAVAELTFVPSDDVSIGPVAFEALAHRAQERLVPLDKKS